MHRIGSKYLALISIAFIAASVRLLLAAAIWLILQNDTLKVEVAFSSLNVLFLVLCLSWLRFKFLVNEPRPFSHPIISAIFPSYFALVVTIERVFLPLSFPSTKIVSVTVYGIAIGVVAVVLQSLVLKWRKREFVVLTTAKRSSRQQLRMYLIWAPSLIGMLMVDYKIFQTPILFMPAISGFFLAWWLLFWDLRNIYLLLINHQDTVCGQPSTSPKNLPSN